MRVFEYMDQDGLQRLTEDEIIAQYYPWWSAQMCRVDKADKISHENCIYDFCVVHWARKVKEENRPKK
jgi:hypothetical protein